MTKWPTMPLCDLCNVIGGGTPAKNRPAYYAGDIPWATVRDMRSEIITETEFRISKQGVRSSATNIIPSGNVVIATRVGLGKVCMVGQDTAINQDLRGIIPRDPQRLSVRFLFWWLKSVSTLIVAEGTGATVQGVKLPFVKSLRVPVVSLKEQKRVVAILDEAFEDIAAAKINTEKSLGNAGAIFDSYLQSVFTSQADHVPLSELTSEITDGDHTPPPKAPSGVPFITISNIVKRTREVDFSQTFMVPIKYFQHLKANKKPRIGDILYTVTGATLGIPVLVTAQRDFCFQRHIGLVRPKPSVDSKWLCYALLSPQVFSQATVGSTGAAQKTVSLRVLRGLQVPRVPLGEQLRIARKLDLLATETQRLADLYETKIAALDGLKMSLLHSAFAGELTAKETLELIEAVA